MVLHGILLYIPNAQKTAHMSRVYVFCLWILLSTLAFIYKEKVKLFDKLYWLEHLNCFRIKWIG